MPDSKPTKPPKAPKSLGNGTGPKKPSLPPKPLYEPR